MPRVEVVWHEGEDEVRDARDRNEPGRGRTLLEVRVDGEVRRFRAPAHGPPIAEISRIIMPQADFDRLWHLYGRQPGEPPQGFRLKEGENANGRLAALRLERIRTLEAKCEALTQEYEAKVRQWQKERSES